jgi:MFS family permease
LGPTRLDCYSCLFRESIVHAARLHSHKPRSIGALLGFATTLYQERLYRKGVTKRGPEARLYSACAAAIIFPVGMFIYAWCAFASVHWMGLAVGIVVFMWGIFIIYAAVFSYLADVYGPFASSALAGQSLARNISGTIFPLFTTKLYGALGYPWSNTIFAILAVAMAPVPYVSAFQRIRFILSSH